MSILKVEVQDSGVGIYPKDEVYRSTNNKRTERRFDSAACCRSYPPYGLSYSDGYPHTFIAYGDQNHVQGCKHTLSIQNSFIQLRLYSKDVLWTIQSEL